MLFPYGSAMIAQSRCTAISRAAAGRSRLATNSTILLVPPLTMTMHASRVPSLTPWHSPPLGSLTEMVLTGAARSYQQHLDAAAETVQRSIRVELFTAQRTVDEKVGFSSPLRG
jgi:hypothetical protein